MIREKLFSLCDPKYRDFQAKLIPDKDPDLVIGVRTPELRKLAKELTGTTEAEEFLKELPHHYFDENQLHAFLISGIKDYGRCMDQINRFLPYVDNWATCDQMSPKVFKKHKTELLDEIDRWIISDKTYTIRFSVKMLMDHFLDSDFDPSYPEKVSMISSGEYYVNMMIAWYFATALAKQYEAVVPYLEDHKLSEWVHRKTIQKAVESFRVTAEHKEYLKGLR